ncbi:hypothetical protein PM082_024441 [Marasmius tenuissimus]|nr:hypothetical protein PM082_024441 [Marasmius tenuissimus]
MAYITHPAYEMEIARASDLKQWLSEHFVFGDQGLFKIPINKEIRFGDTIIQLRGWLDNLCFYELDVCIKFVMLPAEFPPVAKLDGILYDGENIAKVDFGGIKGHIKIYLHGGWMRFGFDFTLTLGDKHSGDVRILPAGILYPQAKYGGMLHSGGRPFDAEVDVGTVKLMFKGTICVDGSYMVYLRMRSIPLPGGVSIEVMYDPPYHLKGNLYSDPTKTRVLRRPEGQPMLRGEVSLKLFEKKMCLDCSLRVGDSEPVSTKNEPLVPFEWPVHAEVDVGTVKLMFDGTIYCDGSYKIDLRMRSIPLPGEVGTEVMYDPPYHLKGNFCSGPEPTPITVKRPEPPTRIPLLTGEVTLKLFEKKLCIDCSLRVGDNEPVPRENEPLVPFVHFECVDHNEATGTTQGEKESIP